MMKVVGLALALAVGATGFALAKDADDEKVAAAEVTKIEETLSTLGCSGYESVKKEEQGIYEIEDAKCKMGIVDIKLDKDYTVILISRHSSLQPTYRARRAASCRPVFVLAESRTSFGARATVAGKIAHP